jgi:hypothetical protein
LANLALFHAGHHLASINEDKKSYTLALDEFGTPVIESHARTLRMEDELAEILANLAKQGKWTAIREKYLEYHRKLVADRAILEGVLAEDWLAPVQKVQVRDHAVRMKAAQDTSSALRKSFEAPVPNFKNVLWSKLNEIFGPSEGGSSFLSVQSPTRYLDKDTFSYKMEGAYSNFVKPVVVNEAEFRLSDQLFDPRRVVGAPNGRSLSLKYEMLLHNLVP